MPAMVPNPLHQALTDALRRVEPMVQEIVTGIDTAYRTFHTGKVWTGPKAKQFDGELSHHNTRVRRAGDNLVADLRQALSRTPPEVTEEVAQRLRAHYDLP